MDKDKSLKGIKEDGHGLSLPVVSTLRRWVSPAPFDKAISLLPRDLAADARKIRRGLLKHKAAAAGTDNTADVCMGMVLRALHAFRQGPVGDMGELRKLTADVDGAAADLPKRALTFCYSELSTEEKGCLQYLAAFNREKSISRTSLVRRCAAERLVSDDKEKDLTVERAERCFDELLFRGFVSPGAVASAAGKEFIEEMCKQENFQGNGLPTHLQLQITIRDAALPEVHRGGDYHPPPSPIMPSVVAALLAAGRQDDAIDKMLRKLKELPTTYRLNVMDLGGCVGILNRSHLRRICEQFPMLKYLSLRNTDLSSADHATDNAVIIVAVPVSPVLDKLPRLKVVELKGLREQHPSALAKDIGKHPNHPRLLPPCRYAS
ncbi:disease resistance RPP8-like protein 3 [Panicum miliaceum]|uniref:Disease resistance RPP8-like protein 3 n=1 Tax=Panicum miliaceum TaxID=4540 RepID=A0A3L6RA58_PANMI|nr:disease resistance RPP8-like protein 3 [Panicum miliaceum]